jgi:multidrug transporter EmrE-like cation transporter
MRLKTLAQQQTQTTNANTKISTYLMIIVLIVLALSVVALFVAFETYILGDTLAASIFAGVGLIAMAMCLFLLYQSRRQAAEVKIDIPKVMTTIDCQNKGCANKTVREFQRGDYVFKDLDVSCGKCGGKQMITAIYKEVKVKEKTYAV